MTSSDLLPHSPYNPNDEVEPEVEEERKVIYDLLRETTAKAIELDEPDLNEAEVFLKIDSVLASHIPVLIKNPDIPSISSWLLVLHLKAMKDGLDFVKKHPEDEQSKQSLKSPLQTHLRPLGT